MKIWIIILKAITLRVLSLTRTQLKAIWAKSAALDAVIKEDATKLTAEEKHTALAEWVQKEFGVPATGELNKRIVQGVVWMRRVADYLGVR